MEQSYLPVKKYPKPSEFFKDFTLNYIKNNLISNKTDLFNEADNFSASLKYITIILGLELSYLNSKKNNKLCL
jgi:hypothetical protein